MRKNESEWLAFVKSYAEQHGKLPDGGKPSLWMAAAWLLLYPEQCQSIGEGVHVDSAIRSTLQPKLDELAKLAGDALASAWGAIAFPNAEAPEWLVDGRTPAMRKDYIVAKLSDAPKPDLAAITGYAPLLNKGVAASESKFFLDGGLSRDDRPSGVNHQAFERITTPYAAQWEVKQTSEMPLLRANVPLSVKMRIRGKRGPIDIARERKLFGPCRAADTLCRIKEDPFALTFTELEPTDETREAVRNGIFATMHAGRELNPNICGDEKSRRFEVIGFPTEIEGDGEYDFRFAISVSRFDAKRSEWVPDSQTHAVSIVDFPSSLELRLAFGRTRRAPPAYKETPVLLSIKVGQPVENLGGLNGLEYNFSYEGRPEMDCLREQAAAVGGTSAAAATASSSQKRVRGVKAAWKRATASEARCQFVSPDELERIELVPCLPTSNFLPPRAPPRATNTGLAFPHVHHLADGGAGGTGAAAIQNVVFAGERSRDVAIDFRLKLHGQDLCETAVVQALKTLAQEEEEEAVPPTLDGDELMFDVALVSSPSSKTIPFGERSFRLTRAYQGIVTVYALLPASTATAAGNNPCVFRLTARHPRLAKTLVACSPPFYIARNLLSVSSIQLLPYDGFLPGGIRAEAPMMDVANHIDRRTLMRCDDGPMVGGSSSRQKVERTYTQKAHEEEIQRMKAALHATFASATREATKRAREEGAVEATRKMTRKLKSILNGESTVEQVLEALEADAMEDTGAHTVAAPNKPELLVPMPVFTIRFHKAETAEASAEFRANSKIHPNFGFEPHEILAALRAASTVSMMEGEERALYPFDCVYFKLRVVGARDNTLLDGTGTECLTTDSGRTLSNELVCTMEGLRSVTLYKVPIKKYAIRLSLDVVTNTSEIPVHLPRDDAAIAKAFESNRLHAPTAYTEPFRVLVTVRN